MLYMVLQFLGQSFAWLVTLCQNNGCLYDITTNRVWCSSYSTLYNCRMCNQCTFDFKRPNAIAGALDDIVISADKPEVSVFVAPCGIAGMIEAVMPAGFSLCLSAIVSAEETDGSTFFCVDDDFADFAGLCFVAVSINYAHIILRVGKPH